MIGKVLTTTAVGGMTLGIYIVISTPTHFDIHPPLRPIPTVTVTVTPTTTKPPITWSPVPPGEEPQWIPPTTTTPFPTQMLCDTIRPTPPNCPVTPSTPKHWPGQHYGETLT